MKRIAIVAHGLSNGGAERVAALLANKLYEAGNKVLFIAVYSKEKKYNLIRGIDYVAIKEYSNRFLRFIGRTKEIDKAIDNFKCDLVISFIINEILLTSIKNRIPVICSLRIDPAIVAAKFIDNLLCNYIFGRAKNIVFQTPDARDYFGDKIRDKGIVIGNFLTSNLPYWNRDNNSKKIITACRLNYQKNLPMLIKGFYLFQKKFPEYSLWIYGDGELKSKLIGLAEKLGISNKVFIPGYVENIHEIMAESAMFVLTSDFEGLSNSMLEALAIGVPTVCTDCPPGGAREYIENGVNGLLIPVGDYKCLARELKRIADDKRLAEMFSSNSKKIREILSDSVISKKWIELL